MRTLIKIFSVTFLVVTYWVINGFGYKDSCDHSGGLHFLPGLEAHQYIVCGSGVTRECPPGLVFYFYYQSCAPLDFHGGGEAPDFNGSKVTKGYVKFEYKHKCPVTGIKIDWWKCKSGTKTQSCPVGAQSVHGPCGQL